MQTHCSNCLKVCWANIPCDNCTYAMYCSEECKDDQWKRCHDIECAVFPMLIKYDFNDIVFLSIRLAVLAVKEAGDIKKLRILLETVDKCNGISEIFTSDLVCNMIFDNTVVCFRSTNKRIFSKWKISQ